MLRQSRKIIWCIKIYNCICQNTKKNEDLQSIPSNLHPNICFKVDFQKVDPHTRGKWLIHDTTCCKDNQLQSLKLPCRISCWVARCDIKGFMSNPIFLKKVQGQKQPGRWEIAECKISCIKILFKTNNNGHKLPPTRQQAIIWTNDCNLTDAYMSYSASVR